MGGSYLLKGLVRFEPLLSCQVLGGHWRRLEVTASDAFIMRRLRVPCRPNRCLYLPIGHWSLQTQHVLLLGLIRLYEERTLGLGVSWVRAFRNILRLILILLVPTRGLDPANGLACLLLV